MMWVIYALHKKALGKKLGVKGLLEVITSTISVKRGCSLFPILFGIYINEVTDHITCGDGEGIDILSMSLHILLYVDDIICEPWRA